MTRQALWLLLVAGCTTPMSSLRADNRRLNETVTELRADRRARDQKVRDLQHQLDKLRADRVTGLMATMPQLPVEVAAPSDVAPESPTSRVVGVTEDGTEIVYEGDAAAGKVATIDEDLMPAPRRSPRATMMSGDRLEVTRRTPPISARTTRVAMRDRDAMPAAPDRGGDAAADYRAAVELVKTGDHAAAIESLRGFLRKYPRHDYADNAQYWLGEAFYAQQDFARALGEFRNVIETYPRGNKVPDALLKVGYCYLALGKADKARAVLEQVVNLYPKSQPAALASKRLESP